MFMRLFSDIGPVSRFVGTSKPSAIACNREIRSALDEAPNENSRKFRRWFRPGIFSGRGNLVAKKGRLEGQNIRSF